jgi:hypothetical protein
MNDLTDNSAILLRLRSQYKRLEQITWVVRELQNRFPLGELQSETQLLKNYLALIYDVEDVLQELKELKKQYEQDSRTTK